MLPNLHHVLQKASLGDLRLDPGDPNQHMVEEIARLKVASAILVEDLLNLCRTRYRAPPSATSTV